jgi:hypothetical protein
VEAQCSEDRIPPTVANSVILVSELRAKPRRWGDADIASTSRSRRKCNQSHEDVQLSPSAKTLTLARVLVGSDHFDIATSMSPLGLLASR